MPATDTPLAALLTELLGPDLPIAIRAYDGTRLGPPEDQAPATIVVRSPDALRRIVTAPLELGIGRAVRGRGPRCRGRHLRRDEVAPGPAPTQAVTEAVGGRGQAHRARRPQAPAAATRGGPPSRSTPQQRPRRRRDRAPLRRLERVLRVGARPHDDVFVRGLRDAGRLARDSAGAEVRPHLPEAGTATGPTTARRRMRLGRDGDARGAALRRAGRGRHDLGIPGGPRREAGGGSRPRGPRRHPPSRLPRRRRRAVRRDQLDRHVRACRPRAAGRVLRSPASPRGARRSHPQPRHQPPLVEGQVTLRSVELHRPIRLPRRRASRGRDGGVGDAAARPRGASRRELARALREDAPPLGLEPRGELG